MFRNSLVVLADPPSSSPFLLRQLSLLPALSQPTISSLAAVEVETLCWKISRRWRLACFLHHPDVFVIYQATQSQSAERALEEFVGGVPGITVGPEEEVASASLVTKAVEIVFRTVMLDHKWACVGNNTFIDSAFAGTDERKNVGAFNLVNHS
ncbi:hypothetical protein BHM03_00045884 [Ensete ventricosum]|nr:hypothetical protein BHM03_00045884 [Ensete ventricosum]